MPPLSGKWQRGCSKERGAQWEGVTEGEPGLGWRARAGLHGNLIWKLGSGLETHGQISRTGRLKNYRFMSLQLTPSLPRVLGPIGRSSDRLRGRWAGLVPARTWLCRLGPTRLAFQAAVAGTGY